MNKIQMKSLKLSREFERKVDNLIIDYINEGVLEADLLRSLEVCKTIPLSKIIGHNIITEYNLLK